MIGTVLYIVILWVSFLYNHAATVDAAIDVLPSEKAAFVKSF